MRTFVFLNTKFSPLLIETAKNYTPEKSKSKTFSAMFSLKFLATKKGSFFRAF